MSWKYFNKSSVSKERMYEVIRSPLITEKGTLISSDNYVGFKVDYSSTKLEIKKAVSELFHVDVVSVNTVRMKGKTKRFRGHKGKRSCFKKAFVRLKSGQSIDLTTGL